MCEYTCPIGHYLTSWFNMSDFVPLVVAMILGVIIGIERELNKKPAGLRTNTLICIGATAFTLIARHITTDPDSSTRVLQGVITGVGFLGAGALIHEQSGVHGLTTAASIWLVTSVGIACGFELYGLATTIVILTMVVLLGLHPLAKILGNSKSIENKKLEKKGPV